MFYVMRVNFKGNVESHSIEQKGTYREALTRFHNIIAADLSNNEVTYCFSVIINEEGHYAVSPFIFNTEPNDEEGHEMYPFEYLVYRIFIKNNSLNSSIEYKNYREAHARYFNILAADLQNAEITFNMGGIINAVGDLLENQSFDHEEI